MACSCRSATQVSDRSYACNHVCICLLDRCSRERAGHAQGPSRASAPLNLRQLKFCVSAVRTRCSSMSVTPSCAPRRSLSCGGELTRWDLSAPPPPLVVPSPLLRFCPPPPPIPPALTGCWSCEKRHAAPQEHIPFRKSLHTPVLIPLPAPPPPAAAEAALAAAAALC